MWWVPDQAIMPRYGWNNNNEEDDNNNNDEDDEEEEDDALSVTLSKQEE